MEYEKNMARKLIALRLKSMADEIYAIRQHKRDNLITRERNQLWVIYDKLNGLAKKLDGEQ